MCDPLPGNFLHRSCIFFNSFCLHPLLTLSSRHRQWTLVQRSSLCPPSWIRISITKCMTKNLHLKILSESWDCSTIVFVWATWGNGWNLWKSGYQDKLRPILRPIFCKRLNFEFPVMYDKTISLQRQVAEHQLSRTLIFALIFLCL